MATGLSLHIGVNHSPNNPPLETCVRDAQSMKAVAESKGFIAKLFFDEYASCSAISKAIKSAALHLLEGDIFFVSFSGHGGQLIDIDGDESSAAGGDGFDETWCCSDRDFIDDELAELWAAFRPGVRILVVSDSCNSGTVTRTRIGSRSWAIGSSSNQPGRSAAIPIGAKGLLIGACRDGATASADGTSDLSLFTSALVETWQKIVATHSKADYREFYSRIHRMLQGRQTPSWYRFGTIDDDFYLEPPFSIEHTIALRRTRGAPSNKIGHQD